MKRHVKRVLKIFWRATAPVRRPFARKIEVFLKECLRPAEVPLAHETNVLMDHVIRELVRLQRQVEGLQQAVEDLTLSTSDPAIAGEIELVNEHLKAG